MFLSDSLAFVVSFGDHYKPMSEYDKYANAKELAQRPIVDPKVGKQNLAKVAPLRRYDTFVLPPMEKSVAPKFATDDRFLKRQNTELPPLKKSKRKTVGKSMPLLPVYDLPPAKKVRSKTIVVDKNVDIDYDVDPAQYTEKENEKSLVHLVGGGKNDSRRSRLAQFKAGEKLPNVLPSLQNLSKDSKAVLKSEAALLDEKRKKVQRSHSAILNDIKNFTKTVGQTKKNEANLKRQQLEARKKGVNKPSNFVKLRKSDKNKQDETQSNLKKNKPKKLTIILFL